eukprot:4961992-Pyramimonas_sp.AAC.1
MYRYVMLGEDEEAEEQKNFLAHLKDTIAKKHWGTVSFVYTHTKLAQGEMMQHLSVLRVHTHTKLAQGEMMQHLRPGRKRHEFDRKHHACNRKHREQAGYNDDRLLMSGIPEPTALKRRPIIPPRKAIRRRVTLGHFASLLVRVHGQDVRRAGGLCQRVPLLRHALAGREPDPEPPGQARGRLPGELPLPRQGTRDPL